MRPTHERGFAAIGLTRPKDPRNVGGVVRAAYCYGASLVAVEGARCQIDSCLDTPKGFKHLPVLRGNDLRDMIPFGAVPVAVDLVEDAVELPRFHHPESAFYVFGPEDGTLGQRHLAWCPLRIVVPTRTCMNLSATVNVVLYDRMAKQIMARGPNLPK